MVIVDYPDIMKSTSKFTEKRHQIGHVYEELRGITGEFDIPIWTKLIRSIVQHWKRM